MHQTSTHGTRSADAVIISKRPIATLRMRKVNMQELNRHFLNFE